MYGNLFKTYSSFGKEALSCHKANPSYSFGKRTPLPKNDNLFVPGPGRYDIPFTLYRMYQIRSFKFTNEARFTKRNIYSNADSLKFPGPGNYVIDNAASLKYKKSPFFAFSHDARFKQKRNIYSNFNNV